MVLWIERVKSLTSLTTLTDPAVFRNILSGPCSALGGYDAIAGVRLAFA
jgi:hypothetical protein